jgi:hypothetical protein
MPILHFPGARAKESKTLKSHIDAGERVLCLIIVEEGKDCQNICTGTVYVEQQGSSLLEPTWGCE